MMSGQKLAKEHLSDLLQIFIDLAAQHQPLRTVAGVHPPNPNADEAKFEKYAHLAMECASRLAPYQSPTYKALLVADQQQQQDQLRTIIDPDEPVRYPTAAEIRAQIAARGLPSIRDVFLEEASEDENTVEHSGPPE